MPIATDIILDWAAKDGYSLSEAGWIQARDCKFYFEVTAQKDEHRHIARALDRETTVVNLGIERQSKVCIRGRLQAGWPMFFRTWGTRIGLSSFVANMEAPRWKNPEYTLAIEA